MVSDGTSLVATRYVSDSDAQVRAGMRLQMRLNMRLRMCLFACLPPPAYARQPPRLALPAAHTAPAALGL